LTSIDRSDMLSADCITGRYAFIVLIDASYSERHKTDLWRGELLRTSNSVSEENMRESFRLFITRKKGGNLKFALFAP
jgi:hypothetical protein